MRRDRIDLAIVLGVALLANAAYLISSNGDFTYPDSATYLAPARSFLHGHGFMDADGMPDALRTPGYPLLLALFGATTLPMILLQHLAAIALAAGVWLVVRRRGGGRAAAMTAALLLAIDPPTIHYANKILSETLFTALLFVTLLLASARPRPVTLGLLSGAMVLVRPIALFYFAVLALVLAFGRMTRRQIAAFVAAALLLPLGWAARNAVETGAFSVSSIGNINLLMYRAAGALAMEDGGDFRSDLKDEQEGLREDADDAIQRARGIPDAEDLPDALRARGYGRYAWGVIARHPWGTAQITLYGLLVNLLDSDWDAIQDVSVLHPDIVRWSAGALPPIELALAAFGIVALWKRDRHFALLIAVTVAYFVLISAGGEAEARFRVPVIPELLIAAAFGIRSGDLW